MPDIYLTENALNLILIELPESGDAEVVQSYLFLM
jgi:hypothetical protein